MFNPGAYVALVEAILGFVYVVSHHGPVDIFTSNPVLFILGGHRCPPYLVSHLQVLPFPSSRLALVGSFRNSQFAVATVAHENALVT